MTQKQYRARVNAAAGTDIRILEKAYLDFYAKDDYANASRLLGIIWSARCVHRPHLGTGEVEVAR